MSSPTTILNSDDPRIEDYVAIRERDLVGRHGNFIAEGSVVLRKLMQSSRYAPKSALILTSRQEGLADIISAMNARDIPVYTAERAVIDAVAGFPLHRGVLAIGQLSGHSDVETVLQELPDEAVIVVCVGLSNHDNIGAVFRNAAGLGAAAVFYDSSSCDPMYRKAIRVSVGSVFEVPHARFDSMDAFRGRLAKAGFEEIALSPKGALELSDLPRARRTALFLGAEGPGLSDALLSQLKGVRIDMQSGFDSLNVATASAIALYSLRLKRLGR